MGASFLRQRLLFSPASCGSLPLAVPLTGGEVFVCGTVYISGQVIVAGQTTLGRIIAPNGQQSTMVAVGYYHAGFIAGMRVDIGAGQMCR